MEVRTFRCRPKFRAEPEVGSAAVAAIRLRKANVR